MMLSWLKDTFFPRIIPKPPTTEETGRRRKALRRKRINMKVNSNGRDKKMIVYKQWKSGEGSKRIFKDGWFLLGIFPIYIRFSTMKGNE